MIADNEFSEFCTADMSSMDESYHNVLKRNQTLNQRRTEVNNERIEITWGNRTLYIPLLKVQQVLDGINSDYTNNELRAMLNLLIVDADRETLRTTEEGLIRQLQHDLTQEYKSE